MKKDKEGIVIIDMAVLDDSEFISPFSMSEIPIINKEVAEFIENSTIGIPPKENLNWLFILTVLMKMNRCSIEKL